MSQSQDVQEALAPGENRIRLWEAMLISMEESTMKGHFNNVIAVAMKLLTEDEVPCFFQGVAAVRLGDVSFSRTMFDDAHNNYSMATLYLQSFKDDPDTEENLKTYIKNVEYKLHRVTKLRNGEADPGLGETDVGELIPPEREESFAEFVMNDHSWNVADEDIDTYPDDEDVTMNQPQRTSPKDLSPTSYTVQIIADDASRSERYDARASF